MLGRGQSATRGTRTTRRFGSSPIDCVATPGWSRSDEVDPAPLEGGHRLELEHLAGLDDARGGAIGELAELALAPAAVVLDVDEDAGPGAHLLGEHQVDQVLERGQALALAPDERAEGLLLVAVGDDVEPARLAGLDLDADVEAEVAHELLEDGLAGGERLGRCLGGLEVGAFGGERAARGGDLGGLGRGQVGRAAAGRGAVAVVAAGPVVATRRAVVARAGRRGAAGGRRGAARRSSRGRSSRGRSSAAGRRGGRSSRRGRGRRAAGRRAAGGGAGSGTAAAASRFGRGAAERGARRGHDPGGLGAHAQDAPAAGRQDLEVEVVELGTERLAGELECLLDGLAGEFAGTRSCQRRLPRRP